MIIPKKVRANPTKDFGYSEAWFDVYSEEYSEDVDCCVGVDFQSDDPKELRKLAKWLEKAAKFLDRCK